MLKCSSIKRAEAMEFFFFFFRFWKTLKSQKFKEGLKFFFQLCLFVHCLKIDHFDMIRVLWIMQTNFVLLGIHSLSMKKYERKTNFCWKCFHTARSRGRQKEFQIQKFFHFLWLNLHKLMLTANYATQTSLCNWAYFSSTKKLM